MSTLTPATLGFQQDSPTSWVKTLKGVPVHFRLLRTISELTVAEHLQVEVFGVSPEDLASASSLVVVQETGGEVIGAFVPDGAGEAVAGVVIGWGGYLHHEARMLSDFLMVRNEHRNLGIGAELKKLQAAIAAGHGYGLIVWTVDPLRAANARLNIEKLGATCHLYEQNRYGESFGTSLYGGLPTDRLHMHWRIDSPRVQQRLIHGGLRTPGSLDHLPLWTSGIAESAVAIELPSDIDTLMATDLDEARRWRMALRTELEGAFAEGWEITGFASSAAAGVGRYLLEPHT